MKNDKSDWLYVPIPRETAEIVDEHIKKHPELGYRSRAEFIRRLVSDELREK